MLVDFKPTTKHVKSKTHKPFDVLGGDGWFHIGRVVWDAEVQEWVFSPEPKCLYSSEELFEISKFCGRQSEVANGNSE